jgi:actin related protein 2/3 complex, subunit 4
MNPLIVSRNKSERVMIEPSINSIRISVKIKQADEMETFLCDKFMRFLFQRAEHFVILRRKPIEVSIRSNIDSRLEAHTLIGLRHQLPYY